MQADQPRPKARPAAIGAALGGVVAALLVFALLAGAAWQWRYGDEAVPGENETGFWLVVSAAMIQGVPVIALCAGIGALLGALVAVVKGVLQRR